MKFLIIFIFLTSLAFAVEDSALDAYKVEVSNIKISKKLYLNSPFALKNKKLLSEEFKKGPNFANHYRLVRMECGKGCASVTVIDMEKGIIFETPLAIDGTADWVRGDILQFKQESRLLVMSGCLIEDKTKCGHHEYSWSLDKFKLEFFRPNN